MLVVERDGPTMFARIGGMRALNRHVDRMFNPARKDITLGKAQAGARSVMKNPPGVPARPHLSSSGCAVPLIPVCRAPESRLAQPSNANTYLLKP
jgi:hypothetical protein